LTDHRIISTIFLGWLLLGGYEVSVAGPDWDFVFATPDNHPRARNRKRPEDRRTMSRLVKDRPR
jgi:hypothetical protein